MTAETSNQSVENTVIVNVEEFRTSIHSILHELEKNGYIDIGDFGYASLTHPGWHAFGVTVAAAVKFTIRDVLVPVLVSVLAATITTWVMN